MRIIAGSLKRRRLLAPRDRAIRPTSERAREALFDILEHGEPPVRGSRFLDLFCGSGAVGLEAYSRGAALVVLVEQDRAALALAQANLARVGAPANVHVLARDASRLAKARHPYDLVFLDPPYRSGLARPTLAALVRGGWLAADARVIVELAAREELEPPPGYVLERERRYGDAKFVFLRPSNDAPPAEDAAGAKEA